MLGRTAGITTLAASALGASAFLIPADVTFDLVQSNDEALTLNPTALHSKQSIVQLPCPECAFVNKDAPHVDAEQDHHHDADEPWFTIQGGANSIVVNFTISQDGRRLEVNGETVYPVDYASLFTQKIYVNQVPASASLDDIEAGRAKAVPVQVTGSGVSVTQENIVTPEGHRLIPVQHSIFELESQPVSLDHVRVHLLQSQDGELFIANVQTEKSSASHPDDDDALGPLLSAFDADDFTFTLPPFGIDAESSREPEEEAAQQDTDCKIFPAGLCRIKSLVEAQFDHMRDMARKHGMLRKPGCHGHGHGHGHGHAGGMLRGSFTPGLMHPGMDASERIDEMQQHEDRPHATGRHPPHHFLHSFARGLAAVLIPTLAGIAVGVFVSLVGLCVGRIIAFLWIHFYRGGRRGYQSVHMDEDSVEEAEAAGEEKEAVVVLLEESEPLPVYEQAPAYEELEGEDASRHV
jgi:hypothetical protein